MASVVGALVLLLVYRLVARRRSACSGRRPLLPGKQRSRRR